MSQPQIDIIPSYNIDQQKWNNCIQQSRGPLIYACTYYLEHMADNWSGIILNDYEAVMPVPWRKKYGIQYSYDVPFVQQLGCFTAGNNDYTSILTRELSAFGRYGNYNFNFQNKAAGSKECTNYIIDLSPGYKSINKHYKEDLLNNLKKVSKQSLVYSPGDYATAIAVYKSLYSSRMPNITEKDYGNFGRLCIYLHKQNNVIVRKVMNANNELLAITLLLKDEHRLYNLMNSTTDAGRKTEANHFLFDEIFKEFAGSNLVFDFEGSDIPGVKSFYEKFGAINQPYYRLHCNKLPFLVKWVKRK